MFVQLRKMTVKEGFADKVIERFSAEGIIEKQEGLIDVTVLEKNVRRGDEEVVVMIRWESKDRWKQWEKAMRISPATKQTKANQSLTI